MLLTAAFPLGAEAQLRVGLNTDSLKGVLATAANDTLRVDTYILLGQQYENNQPDSALYYYQAAKSLSERMGYPGGIVHAIFNYTAVLNVQGDFRKSLSLNLEAVRLSKEHHLTSLLAKALVNTGVVYQYLNRYEPAVDYYLKALPSLEAENSTQALSFVYGNLCGIYRDLKQPSRALVYARKSLALAESRKDRYAEASAYNNLGNVQNDMGHAEKAVASFQKARAIGQAIRDIDIQETALINLGNAYMAQRSPERYIASYREALPLADSLDDVYGKVSALQGMALGLYYEKKYKDAAALLDTAIGYAAKYQQQKTLADMLLVMSDVQIALGRLDQGDRYRASHDSVVDQFMNVSLKKNIQELEVKYDVERKQRELLEKSLTIEKQRSETLRQRRWLLAAAGGVCLLGLSLFWGYRLYRQKQLVHEKTIQALKTGEEASRLKARLEGEQAERRRISQEIHDDLGSDLTRVLFVSRMLGDREEAAVKIRQTIEGLIKKMNEIIWIMNTRQDTLENLVAHIHGVVSEMLEESGIAYHVTLPDNVPELTLTQQFRRNLYLSAKEATHNAIRHSGATEILVDIRVADQVTVTIRDNGVWRDGTDHATGGNGLKNMGERLEAVGGRFRVETSGGTTVTLEAPLDM
jgi:signal transduction histidine kinase